MSIWLLTGAAGYIGAHSLRVQRAGHDVVVLDDLSTASGCGCVLRSHGVDGVVHVAAKKAVAESGEDPLRYYGENVGGLVGVPAGMRRAGVRRLVSSFSAAVYGTAGGAYVGENCPTRPESPYGRTKLMGEWIVSDCVAAYAFVGRLPALFSVLEVLAEFGRVSGGEVPYVLGRRRPEDPASLVARTDRARELLDWTPRHGLADMVTSAWAAQRAPAPVAREGA
jgi:UDP-glucose 4-epimerase